MQTGDLFLKWVNGRFTYQARVGKIQSVGWPCTLEKNELPESSAILSLCVFLLKPDFVDHMNSVCRSTSQFSGI